MTGPAPITRGGLHFIRVLHNILRPEPCTWFCADCGNPADARYVDEIPDVSAAVVDLCSRCAGLRVEAIEIECALESGEIALDEAQRRAEALEEKCG